MFKEDYKRRMKMFNALLGSVVLYGEKIWEWTTDERSKRSKAKIRKMNIGIGQKNIEDYILEEERIKNRKL